MQKICNSNLTSNDLGEELNKVRMHSPDYYTIILTNIVNPNVHDWLEEQLRRHQSYFENKGRNPAFQSIHQTTDLQVYTAGQMPSA